ncbi:MAG: hypothetical protein WBN18_05450 [Flavobacteriaceae bacterium]
MKSSIFTIVMVGIFASQAYAQLDDYKYIVVPKKFNIFSEVNQHQTSTLVKYLFTKKGFTTVYDDEYPDDLNSNRCLGLYVSLGDESTMFMTKTFLILKDCKGREVFMTQEGRSKKKEYKAAYHEAISEAFKSFDTLYYAYSGKGESPEPVTLNFKNDVKSLEEGKVDTVSLPDKKDKAVQLREATKDRHIYKSVEPVDSDYVKGNDTISDPDDGAAETGKSGKAVDGVKYIEPGLHMRELGDVGILYAQEIVNGYQLVDSTPAVRLKILKTTMPNVYLASMGQVNGLVYGKNDQWFLEYYEGDKLIIVELDIKF